VQIFYTFSNKCLTQKIRKFSFLSDRVQEECITFAEGDWNDDVINADVSNCQLQCYHCIRCSLRKILILQFSHGKVLFEM